MNALVLLALAIGGALSQSTARKAAPANTRPMSWSGTWRYHEGDGISMSHVLGEVAEWDYARIAVWDAALAARLRYEAPNCAWEGKDQRVALRFLVDPAGEHLRTVIIAQERLCYGDPPSY